MKYVYLLILCCVVALIIAFKNYKKEAFNSIASKDAPLKFLYGFSMIFVRKKLSQDELNARLRTISLCITAFTLLIFFGLLCTFKDSSTADKAKLKTSGSLEIVENDSTSIEEDSDVYIEDSTRENEHYNYVKETIAIFEEYREDIENTFLDDNESFFAITEPLNLITTYSIFVLAFSGRNSRCVF